ncbi:MAG: hypothetical protein MZW92_74200 [Comamonadaceae bacterium]|nr:hypothetical protein [Comamonadaceae bacterium]
MDRSLSGSELDSHPGKLHGGALPIGVGGDWRGTHRLMTPLAESPWQALLTEAMADACPLPNPRQQSADVLRVKGNQHLDRQLLVLTQQMNRQELTEEDRVGLSSEIIRLRELKKSAMERSEDSIDDLLPPT